MLGSPPTDDQGYLMAVSMLPDSVAYARLLALPYDKIAALVQGGRRGPNAVTVRCPCPDHDDKRPSCTISRGEKKPWVATCPRCGDAVLHALLGLARDRGLLDEDEADHRPPGKGQFADIATLRRHMLAMLEPSNGPIEQWQVFTYHDQIARAVGVSIRFEAEGGKIIRPGRRTTGGWELGAPQAPRPLYRLPQLNGTPVFIVEGEPCADALVALGLDATTSFGGSSAWKQTDWSSLSGYGAVILPDADEPGRKYAEGVAEVTGAEIAALPGFEQRDDGSDVVDWIAARRAAGAADDAIADELLGLWSGTRTTGPRIEIMSGTDVLARTQDWLWDHRVPLGAVTLLAGMPGDGKGLVCMDMAARVTAGEPWPDRPAEMQRRGRVLWFESEDSVDTALIWRARAAGVSLDRIGFYNGVVDSAGKVGFSLAKHLPLLETWLEENNDARLIVFSALTTYARVEGRHGQQETRAMLERLQDLAERYSVAVVGVMHLNQVRDADARSAIKGYGDWVEVARSALLLGAEDNKRKDSPRVLAQCKSNAGERAESMRFAIEAVDVAANDTSQTSPRCAWDLDPCYVSAEELVRLIRGGHNEHGKEPSLQEQAVAVVTEELRANDGWQLSSVLEAAVSAAGLSWQNVRDARRTGKIGGLVVRKLPGQDGGWVWAASDSAFVRACEAEGGG